ncbi:hypothetical protein [Pseudobutyrivibrio ruminis]|uniref:Uncharacterized protein n=1 Tax=Pseudobutyrivibrio ruminis DSM 9787 TaxID=1123011 RepID=A0A285T8B2_9FIRM|nr:hypothetical protein [Pseudobutyrivibrio ruminis]SOC17742.1 hypothetical protein SAMN02910411_0511 [Pseudobutyrivibrio ruminis DSM 9787]
MSYQNQRYDFSKPATVTNLAFKEIPNTAFINVGSYFEMDYGFDLNNVGYTYVDLNSDGSFELIFGVMNEVPDGEFPYDYFERAYTLIDNKPVRFIEGGSRVLFWLGNDGYTYESGSSGAANSGTWKLTFNSSNIDSNWDGWEKTGFSNEAFLGVWDSYIHIDHPFDDIDSEANLSDNQITTDEFQSLSNEWNSRRVVIDWLRLSDYLSNNKLL